MNGSVRRHLVWFAALVIAAVVAVATTEGQPGVPPTALGLGALGLLAAATAAAGWLDRVGPRTRGVLLLGWSLAVGLVAAQDFLRPGITRGHDLEAHAWALWSLWRCVLDGDWWPRWDPYLALGVPLLQFYAPLAYISAWPAQLLGASPYEALTVQMVGAQALSAGTAWWAVRELGGSRSGAALAGLALALAPYHLLDQTFRLALGETLALALLPLPLASGLRVVAGERGRVAWVFGASLVAVLLTHVLSAILVGVALAGLVGGALLVDRRRGRNLGALALAGGLAVAASAAWSLPVVAEAHHTSISKLSKPGKAISPYAAAAFEPLRRRAWTRYGVRKKIGDSQDPGAAMPLYAGCGLLALALLGLAAPRRSGPAAPAPPGKLQASAARSASAPPSASAPRSASGPPSASAPRPPALSPPLSSAESARLLGALAVGLVVLASDPGARLLDGLPVVGRIMFPWRLLSPASVAAALAGGLALDRWLAAPRVRTAGLAAACGLLAFDAMPYLGAAQRLPDREGLGLVHAARGQLHPLDFPRDELVRLEDLKLPPDDYGWRTARARRAFPEYMTPKLRHAYGKRTRPPSVADSERYGAAARILPGRPAPYRLSPDPWVAVRTEGGSWAPAPDVAWTLAPERIELELPAGHPAGRVRFASAWFPGWEARVDGGAWHAAISSSSLLAVDAPAGARSVHLRYSILRPLDRPAGIAFSVATLGGLFGWRRRRRSLR